MADEGKTRQDIWASEASLSLLGPVRLTGRNGEDMTPKARKTRALLAVIALARSAVSRSRLIDLLWGDRGEDQAKASVRQALYELRDLSNTGLIAANRESVALGPKRLWTDVGALEGSKMEPATVAGALHDIEWPPLADLDDITPELDEWLRDERARIASALLQSSVECAEEAMGKRDAASARCIADALQRIEPLDERVARIGARADLALGDRAAAHRRISRLKQRLQDELGLDLSPETRAFLKEEVPPSAAVRSAEPPKPLVSPRSRRIWLASLAVAILIAAASAILFLRSTDANGSPTVAVLPFEDVGQKAQGYFASGVSDEILNLLSHENGVRVLGRVSAAEIANRPNSLEMAQKLGITHVLDGSVRTAGDQMLVIVTLTRVSDGAQMWSERYPRRLGDIFAVQAEIAATVAARLARSFGGPATQSTTPEVYDRYLAARQLVRDRRDVTLREAERLLREAIRIDPKYAPVYAELSQVLILRSDHPSSYGSLPLQQARADALVLAKKAIELDPNLGDAYAAMGFLYVYYESESAFFRKAVELSPQRSEYHRWLAQCLMIANRYDEGLSEYRKAIELDPLWGTSYEHLTGAYQFVGRDKEAVGLARRFMALSTDDRSNLQVLRGMANTDFRLAENLRLSQILAQRFGDERVMQFYLASAYGAIGEIHEAGRLVTFDPMADAILHSDWPRFADAASALGRDYWERANFWTSARILLATGHGAELVRFYDESKPYVQSGDLGIDNVAIPETAYALRLTGRQAEAGKLLERFRQKTDELPHVGLGGSIRETNLATIDAMSGRKEDALRRIEAISRRQPLALNTVPTISLLRNPLWANLKDDPRLAASDERVRVALNAERQKAHLTPISREAWQSDPKTLLTKN